MLERLYVAVDSDVQVELVSTMLLKLASLQQQLQRLPLVLVNPDSKEDDIWISAENNQPALLNWGRWSLEPIGAGWPEKPELLQELGSELHIASKQRLSLVDVLLSISYGMFLVFYEQCLPYFDPKLKSK